MFIFGLLAFLVGQACYVIGFNTVRPYLNLWGVFLVIMLGIYIGWLYPIISQEPGRKGEWKIKNPSADLLYRDQSDGVLRPNDLDAPRLDRGTGSLCKYWRGAVLYIRFDPGLGPLRETNFACQNKQYDFLSPRSNWDRPWSDPVRGIKSNRFYSYPQPRPLFNLEGE